jgi:hypothetical protein
MDTLPFSPAERRLTMPEDRNDQPKRSREHEDAAVRNTSTIVPITTPAYLENNDFEAADKDTYIDEP